MDRREFITTAAAAAAALSFESQADAAAVKQTQSENISAQLNIDELSLDYRRRLFDLYLPFWEKGGYDSELGGFMCELNDDGSVFDDQKFIWYQGRGIWVYSFLYNNFGGDKKYLDIARLSRDFLVGKMYAGKGRWLQQVKRDGTIVKSVDANIYGWLFAAAGLIEYYKACGDKKSLALAVDSIRAASLAYEDPAYAGVDTSYTTVKTDSSAGLRCQGHSMIFVWVLSQLLELHKSDEFEQLQSDHIDAVMSKFWNDQYGIANEFASHDYSRLEAAVRHMYAGHSLETLWMVMAEANRKKDEKLYVAACERFERILDLCWDKIFGGFCDTDFHVLKTGDKCPGPNYDEKTMWSHCEILIGCMMVMQKDNPAWAASYYQKAQEYLFKYHANTPHGIWRQAVDRFGSDKKRQGISEKRRCNFHQPRMLMMNLLAVKRLSSQ